MLSTKDGVQKFFKPFCCLLLLSGSSRTSRKVFRLLEELEKVRMEGECIMHVWRKNNFSRVLLNTPASVSSTDLLHVQTFSAVIINNCNAHWRPKTSVTLLHWHPALGWRLFFWVVNPGSPSISRHVFLYSSPIALEKKLVKKGNKSSY